jgi:hypothetical protein
MSFLGMNAWIFIGFFGLFSGVNILFNNGIKATFESFK